MYGSVHVVAEQSSFGGGGGNARIGGGGGTMRFVSGGLEGEILGWPGAVLGDGEDAGGKSLFKGGLVKRGGETKEPGLGDGGALCLCLCFGSVAGAETGPGEEAEWSEKGGGLLILFPVLRCLLDEGKGEFAEK